MSIPTVYIQGTKKAANERLANGEEVRCLQFTLDGTNRLILNRMPDGTVIKFYDKTINGTPYAKSYGNWRPKKNKID